MKRHIHQFKYTVNCPIQYSHFLPFLFRSRNPSAQAIQCSGPGEVAHRKRYQGNTHHGGIWEHEKSSPSFLDFFAMINI